MGKSGAGRMTAFVSSSQLTSSPAKDYTWQYEYPDKHPPRRALLVWGDRVADVGLSHPSQRMDVIG